MLSYEDERKAEKRAKSEAQRLESIRARKEQIKQQRAILSQALKEVDQKSKRVVFEDSDEDEGCLPSSSDAGMKPFSKHLKLFENSSSEEEEMADISNRHTGKKGEKLMRLEARFNSDSRFKLDEKFLSSGSEEEEDEVTQERTKNLEVLSKVLGTTVKPQRRSLKSVDKVKNGHAKVRPFTRFDPFNEEHVRWLKNEKQVNGIVEEDVASESSEEVKEQLEQDTISTHYEMQPEFAEELKARLAGQTVETTCSNEANEAREGGSFSFLAMVGRSAPLTKEPTTETSGVAVPNVKKLETVIETDHGDDVVAKVDVPKTLPRKLLTEMSHTKFFVTGEEEQVQALVRNFKRTQALEKIVPLWANHRDVFSKNYRHLRKEALKRIRQGGSSNKMSGGEKREKVASKKDKRKSDEN